MYNSAKLLAKRLTEFFNSGKMSKVDLAKIGDIDRSALDLYIKERNKPKIDVLDKLAKAMGSTPWQLIQPDADRSLIEKLIPFDLIEQLSKLPSQKQQEVLSAFNAMLRLANSDPNGENKKKASGS